MFLIFICAFIGYLFDDLSGALVGGLIGFLLSRLARMMVRRGLQSLRERFVDTTFSVMGAICKADGVVTPNEIRAAQELFVQLRLSPAQIEVAKSAFNRGKQPDFDLDAAVDLFAKSARHGRALLQLFLQVQLVAVAADGQVHAAEHAMLVRVARRLGLSEADVAQLEALLRSVSHAARGGVPQETQLDDAYAALGLTREASNDEIKRAYRKLMSENHPDKLAAQGLPESMKQIAEERARQINAAYDVLKRSRQLS